MTERLTRRNFLKWMGIAASVFTTGRVATVAGQEGYTAARCKIGESELAEFSEEVRSGGVPPDGIPSIDAPDYVSAERAEKTLSGILADGSVVFGLEYEGQAFAYPRIIMVWHEIVNEVLDGDPISITYCPLTGSAIGYRGKVSGEKSDFGTSGKLLNSNLVMYDRSTGTESLWSQILGTSLRGPHAGEGLGTVPLVWTTWSQWKEKHPNTSVLTTDTGNPRSYGRDPYGSYQKDGTYYQEGGPMFGVMEESRRFSPKKVVTGVKVNDCALAVPKAEFREQKVRNVEIGGEPLLIVYEEGLDTVRAFSREISGSVKSFEKQNDRLVSRPDGTTWSSDGIGLAGPLEDRRLNHVDFFDVMWFAWYSFFPDTSILEI